MELQKRNIAQNNKENFQDDGYENFRMKSLNSKLREKPVQNRAELWKAPRGRDMIE